jgi:diguanylate cyclase (GGDEF)-like protein
VQAEDDVQALSAQLAATRALLAARTPQDVAAIVATLVRDLGGGLVPARLAQSDTTVQLDVSFGLSEPLLPWADPVSVAWMRLSRVLPGVVVDARSVLDRLQGDARRFEEAERDSLTGLLTRRAWMRRLSAAGRGDAVCLIDLDHFKATNDRAGHAAGDEVLRAIGGLVLRVFRTDDACGRYGGDELACVAVDMPAEALAARADQLRSYWQQQRPAVGAGVGLSVGVAEVGDRTPRLALEAADRALYRAKAQGRDATALAAAEDYEPAGTT